jgi:hypothetical protein
MPLKRPSADEVSKPLKSRRSAGNPNKVKLHSVTAALKKTDTLPDSVIEMLAGMADHCLLEGKDERHAYQRSVIEMVSEALLGIQAALSQEVKEADAIVTGADALKQQRDTALETAKAAVVALEADLVDKKAKLVSDKEAMVAAVASLKEAETAQTQGDLELTEASGKKEKLEAAMTEALNPLKEGGGDKKLLKEIEKLAKPYAIDDSLMEALQRSLKKTAASRSHFDGVAVHEFEVACQKILADLAAVMHNGEPGKIERETKVQGSKAAQEAACAKHAASTAAVSEADAALKQSKVDAKNAEKGVHNFLSEMKEAGNDLDKKKTALQDFQEGPLANFAYLRDPPVPVEEPVVEAVAEQPAELIASVGGSVD